MDFEEGFGNLVFFVQIYQINLTQSHAGPYYDE
jgi:hypothetical protein